MAIPESLEQVLPSVCAESDNRIITEHQRLGHVFAVGRGHSDVDVEDPSAIDLDALDRGVLSSFFAFLPAHRGKALRCTIRPSTARAPPVKLGPVNRRSCPSPRAGNCSSFALLTLRRNAAALVMVGVR